MVLARLEQAEAGRLAATACSMSRLWVVASLRLLPSIGCTRLSPRLQKPNSSRRDVLVRSVTDM